MPECGGRLRPSRSIWTRLRGFRSAPEAWGTRFFGTLIKGSPHPNAAQVLADFMVSPAGQAAVAKDESSVVPNVPGALTTNDKVRVQDLTKLTPRWCHNTSQNGTRCSISRLARSQMLHQNAVGRRAAGS